MPLYKIPLKNHLDTVVIEPEAYEHFSKGYYAEIKLLENLRRHSSGYAVFQRSTGKGKTETIYLHKVIAEKWIVKPTNVKGSLVVTFHDGNPLNLRFENIIWRTRSYVARRSDKTHGRSGFKGVHIDGNRFVATIYMNSDPSSRITLGRFDTAEEASEAYKKARREMFGIDD